MSDASESLIVRSLRTALAQPSVRVGQRLLSERKLAERLNVTHNQMRKSLLDLVDEGVLIQKRGSGTFVRRVPEMPAMHEPAQDTAINDTNGAKGAALSNLQKQLIATANASVNADEPASVLAADTSVDHLTIHPHQILHQAARRHPDTARQQAATSYDIGLWWDNLAVMSPLQQMVLQGMIMQAESLGHRLSVHPMTHTGTHKSFDPQTLRQRVLAHRNDGYLCVGWSYTEFSEFLTRQLGRPVVFFNTDGQRAISSPHVVFDTGHARQKAMEQLQASGCKNVWEIQLNPEQAVKTPQGRYTWQGSSSQWLALNVFDTPLVNRRVSDWLGQNHHGPQGERVDGIYVSDDHLLPGVVEALQSHGLTPGKDVAIITMGNEGLNLPWPVGRWSQLRFDPRKLGGAAVDMLLASLTHPQESPTSIALRPQWLPGQSHVLG